VLEENVFIGVVEPHHCYAAPARGKNFVPAPAPTLLQYIARQKIVLELKINLIV
jgi:hypothetical protein